MIDPCNEVSFLGFILDASNGGLIIRQWTPWGKIQWYMEETGGQGSEKCSEVAHRIWSWCIDKKLWIIPKFIAGKGKVDADRLSRISKTGHEWMLDRDAFVLICKHFGTPELDLFASRLNRQVDKFFFFDCDPWAVDHDALMAGWHQNNLAYSFPPFSLIPSINRKVRSDRCVYPQSKGNIVIVFPNWLTQL